MEDYKGAASARLSDVEALLGGGDVRCVAAAHVGGAAVECQLKNFVARYHGIEEWEEKSSRLGDPKNNQIIKNPGHSLLAALRLMHELRERARLDKDFLKHLNCVMHP